jgi:hypothetical protein
MAAQTQRWRPDTCGCVIIQTHDPADLSVPIGLSHFERKCPAHSALNDAEAWEAVFDANVGENRRKNRIRNRIFEQFGVEIVSWSFSGTGKARVLTIVTSGLTANQRNAAQTWANTNLGAGRVVIQ